MTLYKLAVGELYNPAKTSWPEVAQYNYRGGMHELVLFYSQPTNKEIRSIRKERFEAGLFIAGMQIIFLYRFEDGAWSDAPFSIHLVPEAERILPPEITLEEKALLQIILVDADTGIIRALRALSMTTVFTAALHQAIRKQAGMEFSQAAYDFELAALQHRYGPEELAGHAMGKFSSYQVS